MNKTQMASIEDHNLHVFFLPYFTTSHLIPLVHTARLFASRGIHVTIATTPANALLFKSHHSEPNITVRTLPFPSHDVGLPPGIENFGHVTSPEMIPKLGQGIAMLQDPMDKLIRESNPDCIVSDMFFPWTVDLAEELQIPRLVLHLENCFHSCVSHSLKVHSPHKKIGPNEEEFIIPGLPDEIRMKLSQLEDYWKITTPYGQLLNTVKESDSRSYGVIFTSYHEFEHSYVNHYNNIVGQKCWLLGLPSDFINRNNKVEREDKNKNHDERHSILGWLDDHESNSVLYVCFGSMIRFPNTQFRELALALERSGHPFVWVIRKQGENEEDFLPEGFEERIRKNNRGLIVREWAPQTEILCHVAVGGFMTHCGWNSLLEGIIAGVPFITWPLFAEQFYNEMFISRVMKIGIVVGSEVWNSRFEIKSPIVENNNIAKAIRRLMCGSDEANEIQRRVKEFSLVAKKAVVEGGSAWCDLDCLIMEIKSYGEKK